MKRIHLSGITLLFIWLVLSTGEVFAGPYEGNPFPTFAFFGFLSQQLLVAPAYGPVYKSCSVFPYQIQIKEVHMKRIQMSGVALVFILLGWISCAHASAIMFTDRSAWQTEISGLGYSLTNIDFENATTSSDFSSVTAGDVVFSCNPGDPLLISGQIGSPYDSGKVLYPFFNQPIQVELPGSVYAFGFDLGEYQGTIDISQPILWSVELSTGDAFIGPYYGDFFPTLSFFGFYSDFPITSLSMLGGATMLDVVFDNFTYAQATAPVPEPSSLLLLSSGIFGFVANAWRNRRR